jgi:hypothetical protein
MKRHLWSKIVLFRWRDAIGKAIKKHSLMTLLNQKSERQDLAT